MTHGRRVFQASVSILAMVAWFGITNHCALGAAIAGKTQSPMAQMHCHGSQPSPAKKSRDEETPCCKLLRATIASNAKTPQPANHNFLGCQNWIISGMAFSDEALSCSTTQELDTGPPFASSFAESVLQRSILAHAPPIHLS